MVLLPTYEDYWARYGPQEDTMTTQYCTIVKRRGPRYPDGHSTIYQLRAGRKGTGQLLAQHEARGDWRAHDQARDGLRTVATAPGIAHRYTLIDRAESD